MAYKNYKHYKQQTVSHQNFIQRDENDSFGSVDKNYYFSLTKNQGV